MIDTTVYPAFNVNSELDRARASAEYHRAQARYYEDQVRLLTDAAEEQRELEYLYAANSPDELTPQYFSPFDPDSEPLGDQAGSEGEMADDEAAYAGGLGSDEGDRDAWSR